jgi:hypothetical protein
LEIRLYSADSERHQGAGTALEHIRMLADTVHNLPAILDDGERRDAWPGPGFHTFYWMWSTASPAQKRRLILQFSEMGYDYSYLDQIGPWPVYSAPATGLSLRRGGWRIPRDISSVKAIDTATAASLKTEAYEHGLSGGKCADWLIAHLDPLGTHVLVPKRSDDVFFGPKQDGVWEYRALLCMLDGAVVVGNLRATRDSTSAVPAGLSQRQQMRLAALPTGHDRDVYLWSRDHKSAEPDRPLCATLPQPPPTRNTQSD